MSRAILLKSLKNAFTILYEIDDIHCFSDFGKFISYCWLVKCSHELEGKKEYVFEVVFFLELVLTTWGLICVIRLQLAFLLKQHVLFQNF